MTASTEQEIERLHGEVSVEVLVRAAGIDLEVLGNDLVGPCPFHADGGRSLVVTPGTNSWRCVGACDAGGDVIGWVKRIEGVSASHATQLLQEGYIPKSAAHVVASTVPKLATIPAPTGDAELLEIVTDYDHQTLKRTPEALSYLPGRGLTEPAMIDAFRLGFSDRTLGSRLPQANRRAGAELRGRLQAMGVMRATGHEQMRGSLVIPITNAKGVVVDLYGRKVRDDLRAGTPDHLYLQDQGRGVFNPAGLQAEEIILCEAPLDALTFWCAGVCTSILRGGQTLKP